MANIIETITKYLPSAVDKVFMADSKTAVLENGSKWIDVSFQETGYVKIANVLMDGLANYKRVNENSAAAPAYAHYAGQNGSGARDGFHVGNAGVQWEIFQLQWLRGKEFQVDYISDEESAGTLMANLMTEFVRTKVVPEADACRFAEMFKKTSTSLGNRVTGLGGNALTASNVIKAFNAAYEWLSEHEVPAEEQVIFVSPRIMTFIRECPDLVKFLTQTDYKNDNGVEFTLKAYEGRPIIEVPSNRFISAITLSDNGYLPASGAYALEFMVVSKKAIVPIRKLEYNKIFKPGEVPGFYGYVADFLFYHGVVIPKNKVPGIFACVSSTVTAASVSRKLMPLVVSGDSTGAIKVTEFFTQPAGLFGSLVVNESSIDLDAQAATNGVLASGYQAVTLGASFTTATTADTVYFGLVDGYGKVIAISGAVDVSGIKAD